MSEIDLTEPEKRALLWVNGHPGWKWGLLVRWMQEQQLATIAVMALEAKGLIENQPGDASCVVLTPAGRALVEKLEGATHPGRERITLQRARALSEP